MRLVLTQAARALRYCPTSHRQLSFSYPRRLNMTLGSTSNSEAVTDTEGLKVAQEIAHEVEETLG